MKNELYLIKENLEKMIEKKGVSSQKALSLSVKIDEIIMKHYNIHKTHIIGITDKKTV